MIEQCLDVLRITLFYSSFLTLGRMRITCGTCVSTADAGVTLLISLCRKLMKAKGPAAAKVEEEKKKGLALFGPKPPTPKLLRAFGGSINKNFIDKVKVTHVHYCHRVVIYCNYISVFVSFPSLLLEASEDPISLLLLLFWSQFTVLF